MVKNSLLLISIFFISGCQTVNSEESRVSPAKIIKSIDVTSAQDLIEKNSALVVVDIRTPQEVNEGFITETDLFIDFYNPNFRSQINQLDKNTPYLIYCRSGNRSAKTLSMMKNLGFSSVYNLEEGINSWK